MININGICIKDIIFPGNKNVGIKNYNIFYYKDRNKHQFKQFGILYFQS